MAGDAKVREEDELVRVQGALAVAEEARRKTEAEVASLEVERTSLPLEVGVTKDEVSSLQSQASKDKVAREEDYQKALELIIAYGYGCCMFKHNIYGDQPKVPDGMPDSSDPLPLEFFVNPRCPLALVAIEAIVAEVDQSEAAEKLDRTTSNGVRRRSNRSFQMRTMTVSGSSPIHSPRRVVPYFTDIR